MIVFVSIFLGLILGAQNVVVAVSEEVTRVEILLDGELEAVIEGAPWNVIFDFGDDLLPRELVAVAYDVDAQEVARAHQILNLAKPAAVAELVIEGERGQHSARLVWESTAGAEPLAVRVSMDGESLEVSDLHSIALPPHDPTQMHFLRAELDFGNNVTSVTEMTFGGTYGAAVTTEITAVPITIPEDASADMDEPTVESLQGRFRKGDESLVVVALERGPAEVVVVVDRAFGVIGRAIEASRTYHPGHPGNIAASLYRMQFFATLRESQRLRLMTPEARQREGVSAVYNIFPMTDAFTAADAGAFFLLSMLALQRQLPAPQQLSDAVAVAGLTAAGTQRPRAVVLALGRKSEDSSQIPFATTRAYLEALRVPLYVWHPRKKLPAEMKGWGDEVVRISSRDHLDSAMRRLGRDLERQWIVWLDGVHMPQMIELAPGNDGIQLAR